MRKEPFSICITEDRRLPFAYIDDILDGTIKFLETPIENLTKTTYNVNSLDFSPKELTNEIMKYYFLNS